MIRASRRGDRERSARFTETRMNVKRRAVAAALAACGLGAGGCAPIMLTALGVGMATEVSHTLSGMVYKTFTAPQAQVKRASNGALHRMQIRVVSSKKAGSTETIAAR